jgi:hypothetical protein
MTISAIVHTLEADITAAGHRILAWVEGSAVKVKAVAVGDLQGAYASAVEEAKTLGAAYQKAKADYEAVVAKAEALQKHIQGTA